MWQTICLDMLSSINVPKRGDISQRSMVTVLFLFKREEMTLESHCRAKTEQQKLCRKNAGATQSEQKTLKMSLHLCQMLQKSKTTSFA